MIAHVATLHRHRHERSRMIHTRQHKRVAPGLIIPSGADATRATSADYVRLP